MSFRLADGDLIKTGLADAIIRLDGDLGLIPLRGLSYYSAAMVAVRLEGTPMLVEDATYLLTYDNNLVILTFSGEKLEVNPGQATSDPDKKFGEEFRDRLANEEMKLVKFLGVVSPVGSRTDFLQFATVHLGGSSQMLFVPSSRIVVGFRS